MTCIIRNDTHVLIMSPPPPSPTSNVVIHMSLIYSQFTILDNGEWGTEVLLRNVLTVLYEIVVIKWLLTNSTSVHKQNNTTLVISFYSSHSFFFPEYMKHIKSSAQVSCKYMKKNKWKQFEHSTEVCILLICATYSTNYKNHLMKRSFEQISNISLILDKGWPSILGLYINCLGHKLVNYITKEFI